MPKRLPPLHRPPRIEIAYPRRQSADSGPTNAAISMARLRAVDPERLSSYPREPQLEWIQHGPVAILSAHSDEYRRQPSGAFTVRSQDQRGV